MEPESQGAAFLHAARIVVDPLSRLDPQALARDQLLEERTGPVSIADLLVEVLEDRQDGVQSDEIRKLEGAHGMPQAQADSLVDVLGGADVFHEQMKGFVDE